jgi:hypothetical protein
MSVVWGEVSNCQSLFPVELVVFGLRKSAEDAIAHQDV